MNELERAELDCRLAKRVAHYGRMLQKSRMPENRKVQALERYRAPGRLASKACLTQQRPGLE
jgi:hypothetical protein